MAAALAYLHDPSRNIVHRDSDNVLLKLTDSIPVAKVADFGMSWIIDCTTLSHTLTAMGHRASCMPPEASLETSSKYDSSFDIFMLGAIMIQISRKINHISSKDEREKHMKAIHISHPLKKCISECLRQVKEERPRAADLTNRFQ